MHHKQENSYLKVNRYAKVAFAVYILPASFFKCRSTVFILIYVSPAKPSVRTKIKSCSLIVLSDEISSEEGSEVTEFFVSSEYKMFTMLKKLK